MNTLRLIYVVAVVILGLFAVGVAGAIIGGIIAFLLSIFIPH